MLQPYRASTLTLVWACDWVVMKNGQMHMYSVTNSEMETQQSEGFDSNVMLYSLGYLHIGTGKVGNII